MILRICNHCGRRYDSELGSCPCRKRKYINKLDNWYNSKAWQATSRFVRMRDNNLDRLQERLSCLYKAGKLSGIGKILGDLLLTATGEIRRFSSAVMVVHHIVPREDDAGRWYDLDNLITLNSETHAIVHYYYEHGYKAELQSLLFSSVHEDPPAA